jgi:PAS domain S-box-containing protein
MGLVWGVIATISAMVVLAISLMISMSIHSRKMRESERRFQLLFDKSFDAIFLTNENGQIIDLNQSAAMLIGIEKGEIIGREISAIMAEDDASQLQALIRKALTKGGALIGEVVLVDRNLANHFAEATLGHFEFLEDDYLIFSFRDITERQEAAEALREESQNLHDKNVALKEVLQHIEFEKTEIKRNIAEKIEQSIIPLLKKTIGLKGPLNENYYNLLLDELQRLSGSAGKIPSLYLKLSPREIEICKLIKTGATTKDIATTLNISVATVNKHRERIRNRLDIAKKDINLASFLKNLNV